MTPLWLVTLLLFAGLSVRAQDGRGLNGGAFSFATNVVAVGEKEGNAVLAITRNSEVGKMQVDVIAVDGTALNNTDFTVPSATNTITFSNLQTALYIFVPITDNTTTNAEGSINATFQLANPRPAPDEDPALTASLGTVASAELVILDDDRELEFNLERTWYLVNEPQPTNTVTLTVNVTLANPPTEESQNVSVEYQVLADRNIYTKPGSEYASAGADFEAIESGTVEFGPNDVSRPIEITINSDTLLEFNEDFHVVLTRPNGTLRIEAPAGGTDGGGTGSPLRAQAVIPIPGTDGGTDAGGTDAGGGGEATELPYALGQVTTATVTILFNGERPQEIAAGSLDLSFNPDNDPTTTPPFNPSPGANLPVSSVARDAEGRFVIGGVFTAVNAVPRNRIARLTPDGQLDPTFAAVGGANDFVSAVLVYTNGVRSGQVLLAGGFTSVNGQQRNGIARLNVDGSIDSSFQPGSGANGPVYAMALQSDGTILIGGDFTQVNGVPRAGIARLTEDGAVDLAFDPGNGANGPVYSIATMMPEPLIVTNRAPIGEPSMFIQDIPVPANSGFLTLTYNFFEATNNLFVLVGSNIIHSSGLTNHFVISTNSEGAQVTNYPPTVVGLPFVGNTIRIVINTMTNANTNWTFTASIQPDIVLGSVIGGDFTAYNGVEHGRVARLNMNGESDLVFNQATGLGADAAVRAVALQSGRVILGGSFQSFNSFASGGIAALNPDGSYDRTFATGSGAEDGDVLALRVLPDNKILVGGNFTIFNDTRRIFLTRLLTNGPVDTSFLDPSYNQYAGFPDRFGQWPIGAINSFTIDPTNNVIVAGAFSLVGGGSESRVEVHPRNNIARLHGGVTAGPGNLELAQATFGADENAPSLPVTAIRRNGSLGSGQVFLTTLDGGATSTNDYVGATNVALAWPAAGSPSQGSTANQMQPIAINDDDQVEGDENFSLRLSNPQSSLVLGGEFIPAGFALGTIQSANALIIENDVAPSVFEFSEVQYDHNENDGNAVVTVTRSGPTSSAVSVRYSTVPDTGAANPATEQADYTPVSGILSFTSGQSTRTFTVSLRDDQLVEQDETVRLVLSAASSGASLGTNSAAILNIIDNDYAPGRVNLSATNYTTTEGQAAQITVRRTGGNVGVLRVTYSTIPGSATVPRDYSETAGTLQWNDRDSSPRVITIPITEDGLVETNKQFTIALLSANPPGALGIRTNAVVTIQDDDSLGVFAFNAAEYLADENGTNAVVNIVRRSGSAETASIGFATFVSTNFNAVPGTDYQPTNGVLTFLPGETSKSFAVPLLDNDTVDPERRIGLLLTNASPLGASIGVLSNAFITIVDNELFNLPAGSVETDFGTLAGADDAIQTLALQPDGRILIGGDFLFVNRQVRTHLARLNADSTLDPNFGLDFTINDSVRDIVVQSDNRIVIAGAFTEVNGAPYHHLARFGSGGTLDSTFDIGSGADNPVFSVVETFVGGSRKLLIGGQFSVFNGVPRRGIARVNDDGRTDLSFDPGSGINGTVYTVVVQRDGRILVGGEFTSVGGVPRINIARLNPDGSLDTSFDAGLGADGSVRTIAVQFDDRILIGGLFTSVSGVTYRHVARLNADGTLDSTFNVGTGADGAVYAIALQLDGNIVVAGDFTSFNNVPKNRIVRLNPNGSIDPSVNFGTGANAFIGAVVIQPDRRILVGGGFTTFDGLPRNRVARLYGGSLKGAGQMEFAQPDFRVGEGGTNLTVTVRRSGGLLGAVSIQYATQAGTASPAVDYNDVSGTLNFAPGENVRSFVVPILNDNLAEPDETVNLVLSNPQGGAVLGNQPVATISIVSDDSVISFAELNYTINESAPGGRAVIQIIREGDPSAPVSVVFSTAAGTALAGQDFLNVATNVIFAAGQSNAIVTVPILDDLANPQVEENKTVELRLTSPGAGGLLGRPSATLTILDNDFAAGLLSVLTPTPTSESSAGVGITVVRNSGRTGAISVRYSLQGGTASAGVDFGAVSGTLSFLEGETSKSFFVPFFDDQVVEGNESFIVVLSDASGGAEITTPTTSVLILDDDFGPGSLDTSFNTSGGASGTVREIEIQPDGKILVAGSFDIFANTFVGNVTRLDANGAIDPAFATGSGTDGPLFAVARQVDGKIAVGGSFNTFGGIFRPQIGKMLTNGFGDANFFRSAGENGTILALAAQPDGKLLAGGEFTSPQRHLIRLNADGSLDVSFNPDSGTDAPVRAIAVLPNGRILIGGSFTRVGSTAVRGLARLLSNGLLDSSFQIGTGVAGTVNAISVAPDGKILIGGDFTGVNGSGRTRVARLNADGSVDFSFTPDGPNGVVNDVMSYRGNVYIAGNFTSVAGTPRRNVARLDSDGTLDPGFDPGIGPDNTVFSIAAQANGQILIAGAFQTVNGFFTPGIARLNAELVQPNQPIQLSVAHAANGFLLFSFTSEIGLSYVIEASSDLATWETVDTRIANAASTDFNVPTTGAFRFFRVRPN